MTGFRCLVQWWSNRLSPLAIGLLLTVTGNEVSAGIFGFGKKYEVQLFPVVEGRITKNGVPQPGVTVVREATYDDAEIQETVTGADGRFSFPPWTIRSRTPGKAFVEDRLRQVLAAEHEGEQYLLWYYVTGRIDGEQVIAEKLGALYCDLNDDEISHHFQMIENPSFTHDLSSICRWGQDETDQ